VKRDPLVAVFSAVGVPILASRWRLALRLVLGLERQRPPGKGGPSSGVSWAIVRPGLASRVYGMRTVKPASSSWLPWNGPVLSLKLGQPRPVVLEAAQLEYGRRVVAAFAR
jgi:hypothetical protein